VLETFSSPEICRLALTIGAFVAIKYKDKYGVIPGGIIVPGFIITLFLMSPGWCLTVIALAFLVYWVYQKFLAKTGYKRRTPMYLLATLSLAITNILALVYIQLGWLSPSLDNLSGTLLPAVIAFTFTKQKMVKVVKGIVVTTLITAVIVGAIYGIGSTYFHLDFDLLRPIYAGKEILHIKYPLFQFYVSLAVGYLVYRTWDVRSGGYMIAPVAVALMTQPLSAVAFLLGCFTVYWLTKIICQFTFLIGLKRYALVMVLSTILVWSIELIFAYVDSTILPFQGSNIFVIIAMMSYVNDYILYVNKKIISCLSISLLAAFVVNLISNFATLIFI
jgi:hypothetical protein